MILKQLPPVPEIKYIYCLSCEKMYDLLLEDHFQEVDEDNYGHQCEGCGSVYIVEKDQVPSGEREAYEKAISFSQVRTDYVIDEITKLHTMFDEVKEQLDQSKAIVRRANTELFILEKSAKDIQKFIKKKKYQEAIDEAVDIEMFVIGKKNKDKAKKENEKDKSI